MKTQIRNFFRHAELVGVVNAVVELVCVAVTSHHFRYTDDGVLYSESVVL